MFQHILVPVDYTKKNRHALDIAVNLAQSSQALVSVLHVIEIIYATPVEEFKSFYTALEEQAMQKMQDLLAPYNDGAVQIERMIRYGNRVQEIVRFAQEQGIDLVVMNSHRLDPNQPAQGWGTISYKVSILTECPVLLVK